MLSLGIHIRERSLSAVELLLKGAALELKGACKIPLESCASAEQRRLMIAQKLQELGGRFKGGSARFCFGLPQSQVSCFPISFPFKEKFKILKTLPFEIEDKSPFLSDKTFSDARIAKITAGGQSRALCFAAPEEKTGEFLQLIKASGISLHLLTADGSALANLIEGGSSGALSPARQAGGRPSLYIYLGLWESAALFFKEGSLEAISAIDWGISAIIRKMEARYQIPFDKALDEFFDKSFILTEQKGWTKEQVFFSRLIKSETAALLPKLRLLELSFKTQSGLPGIEEGLVFGPGSAIKNLSAYLSGELSMSFSRLKALPRLPGLDLTDPKNHSFLIPFGLAMEGLKKAPYSGVNLLHSLNPGGISFFPKAARPALAALGAALFVFAVYSFARDRSSRQLADQMRSVFVNYGKKIAFMRESQVSADSVKGFLDDQKALLQSGEFIKKRSSGPGPIDWLQALTKGVGPRPEWGMRIAYLKLKDRKVQLKGEISRPYLETLKGRLKALAKGPLEELPPERTPQSAPPNPPEDSAAPPPPSFLSGGPDSAGRPEPAPLAAGVKREPDRPLTGRQNDQEKASAESRGGAAAQAPEGSAEIQREGFAFSFELRDSL